MSLASMYAMIRNDEADKANSPYCFQFLRIQIERNWWNFNAGHYSAQVDDALIHSRNTLY